MALGNIIVLLALAVSQVASAPAGSPLAPLSNAPAVSNGGSASGLSAGQVEVPSLLREIQAGEIIGEEDVVMKAVDQRTARYAAALEAVIGMEAKRKLAAGSVFRPYDVMEPQLVRKGEKVLLVLQKGSMKISVTGKAMTGGAIGKTVRVQNLDSYALLEGEVTGAGIVTIMPRVR